MRKSLIYLILIIINATAVLAQNFRATAQPDVVAVGDRIQITYSIDTEGSGFKPPKFDGFKTLMGPSTSQNMQIINGRVSRSISFTYLLEATKEGKFIIPGAKINVNGSEITSNSTEIVVTKPSQAKLDQMKKEEEQSKNQQTQAIDIINNNLKIKVNVDKTNVFIGEPVVATYKIYMHPQLNVLQLTPDKIPQLNGFWNQEFNLGEIRYGLEQADGTTYRTATIKKVILFPQQSGQLTVDSYNFNTIVRLQVQNQRKQRNRDPFQSMFDDFFGDSFFGGGYKDFETVVKSPAIQINVKDLPKGAPSTFTNAVGKFTANSWLDKTTAKAGEAVTYKFKISGKGNLKLISAPELNLPPNFEVYDPKMADNTKITPSNVEGDLIFEYILIPQSPGEYKIPKLEFTYFDLVSKKYEVLTTDELKLKVTEGDNKSFTLSGANKEDVKLLNQDIDFIKTSIGENKNTETFYLSAIFFILAVAPFPLVLLFLLWIRKQKEERANQSLYRKSKARKIAQKRLSSAKMFLLTKDFNKFSEEINRAVWGFLSDKFVIQTAKLTRDNIEEVLKSKNAPSDTVQRIIQILDKCEYARYAPASSENNFQPFYDEAELIISEIEEKLK